MKCITQANYLVTGLLLLFLTPNKAQADISFDLPNVLKFDSIETLIVGILNIIIVIAIPIIVLFIIAAGFMYVTAKGNVEQVQKATRALTYAIIGGVLILGAVALSQVVANIVGAFTPA